MRILSLFFVWCLCGVGQMAFAANPLDPPNEPTGLASDKAIVQPGCTRIEVERTWKHRQTALEQGRVPDADADLEAILLCKQRAGWPDFFAYGEAMAFESRAAAASGNLNRAKLLAQGAFELAPHRVAPYTAMATVYWNSGDWKKGMARLYHATGVMYHETPYRIARFSTHALWLILSLAIALTALTCATLYRYAIPLWHDFGHRMPLHATVASRVAVFIFLVLVPALLRLGPLTWALFWLLAIGPYLRVWERRAAMLYLAILWAGLAAYTQIGSALAYPGSKAELGYMVVRDLLADKAANALVNDRNLTARDAYSLGLRARWQGNITDSRRWLEQAAEAGEKSADLFVFLGNARYLQQAPNEAMGYFQQALKLDPNNIYALFNLSQVRLANAIAADDAPLSKANQLNSALTARLTARVKKTGVLVADPPVPAELLNRRLSLDPDYHRALGQLFRALGGPIPYQAHATAIILLLLYYVWLGLAKNRKRYTTDCRRCGTAICMRCTPQMQGCTQCAICTQAVVSGANEQQNRQERIQKEIASHRFFARRLAVQRRIAWIIPGAGQLLKGEALRGMLIVTIVSLCLLGLATTYGYLPQFMPLYSGLTGVWSVIRMFIVAGVYVVALVFGVREEL